MPAPTPHPVAHPYARISDPQQRKGGGMERQTLENEPAVREFCRLHGFTPGKKVWADDGVSAWKGAHTTPKHQLGQFLAEARRGRIPGGDCLLIENYDRLSRQDIWAAIGLVNDLRQLGIHVGRLDRMKLLRCDSKDPGDFFEAAVELMRGNSESNAKSDRNGKAWERKRKAARLPAEGRPVITHRLPAWVRERDGKLEVIPERAEAVRRIFELAGSGHGLQLVLKRLKADGVPAFVVERRRPHRPGEDPPKRPAYSGHWTIGYLHKIMRDRRALGEFQPMKDGAPDGPPVPDYFPRVVSEAAWERARQAARGRDPQYGGMRGKVTEDVNVFQGLLKGARDGEPYSAATEPNAGNRRRVLRSTAYRKGKGSLYSFPLQPFEDGILSCLREVNPHDILNGDQGPDESLALGGELARLDAQIAALEAEMVAGDVPSLVRALRHLEERRAGLADRLAEARQKAAHPLSEAWGEAQTLLSALRDAPDPREARLRLREALRRVVHSVWLLVVPRGRDRLCAVQLWFKRDDGGRPDRQRSYLILHRPPKANASARQPGCWWVRSLAAAAAPGGLDLRDPEHARQLEKALNAVDLNTPEEHP